MDPDESLRQLRAAIEAYHAAVDQAGRRADHEAAAWSMAEYAHALDTWLSRGGHLPTDWARPTGLPTADEPR